MKLKIRELVIFAMLGALMFALKLVMEQFPNIHLVGIIVVAMSAVYRSKALYPLYLFVFLFGLYYGFSQWWLPYLYIWTLLWGAVMLVPQRLSDRTKNIMYIVLCGLHGFLYGTLYAPAQALLMGFDFKMTIAWIINGLPFDLIHGVSNLVCGILILPIIKALKRADNMH